MMKTNHGWQSLGLLATILCLLGSTVVAAQGNPLADQNATVWLDRWAEAMGGRAAISAISSLHLKADVKTSGLTGTYEQWLQMSGRRRGNLSLGDNVFRQESLHTGDTCLRKDANGKVSAVQGIVLARELSGLYFDRFAYLFPERHAAEITVTSEGATDTEIGLAIRPVGGEQFTVYLDKVSMLPTRQAMKEGDRLNSTWVSDWRPVAGVLFPYQTRQGQGDDAYDVFVSITDLKINEPVDESVFRFDQTEVTDAVIAGGGVSPDIEFKLNANHVYVPVKVNGAGPFWFALDTGAEMTVLQRRTAEQLKLALRGALEGRGAGTASVDVALVSGVNFELPGVTVSGQRAAVMALGEIEGIEGFPMEGILGYDFISRFVVRIDYAAGSLRLYDPKSFAAPAGARPIPFTIEGNDPIVEATVTFENCPPVKGRFLLDTGKRSGVSISSPEVNRLSLLNCLTPTIEAPQGFGVGGQTKQRIGRLKSFTLGQQRIDNLLVALSQDTSGATATTDFVGMIGGEILRRFTVTIDYSRYQLYLEPNKLMTEREEYNMSGMILKSDPPEFKRVSVYQVVAGSPAGDAGLQAGDELLKINGQPVAEVPLEQFRRMFLKDNSAIKVEWRRGEKTSSATLTMRRLI